MSQTPKVRSRMPAMLAVMTLLWSTIGVADSFRNREQRLIAALVFRITQLVEWPTTKLGSSDQRLRVCLIGDDVTGGALAGLEGRRLQGRTLQVDQVSGLLGLESCHVLYFGSVDENESGRALEAVRNKPVLTASERRGFATSGGTVQVVRRTNTVGFHVNPGAAKRAGLELDPRIVQLAAKVVSTTGS